MTSIQLQQDQNGYYYEYSPTGLGQHNIRVESIDETATTSYNYITDVTITVLNDVIVNGKPDKTLKVQFTYLDDNNNIQPLRNCPARIRDLTINQYLIVDYTDNNGILEYVPTGNLTTGTRYINISCDASSVTASNNLISTYTIYDAINTEILTSINGDTNSIIYHNRPYLNYNSQGSFQLEFALINTANNELLTDQIINAYTDINKTNLLFTRTTTSTSLRENVSIQQGTNNTNIYLHYDGTVINQPYTKHIQLRARDELKQTIIPPEQYYSNGTYTGYYNSSGTCETVPVKIQVEDGGLNTPQGIKFDVYDQNDNKLTTITTNNQGILEYNCNNRNITELTFEYNTSDNECYTLTNKWYYAESLTVSINWTSKYLVRYECTYETPCYWGLQKNIVLTAIAYKDNEEFPLNTNTLTLNGGTLTNYQITTDGQGQAHYMYNHQTKIPANSNQLIFFTVRNTETYSVESTEDTFDVTFIAWDNTSLQVTCVDDDLTTPNLDGLRYDIPTIFKVLLRVSPNGSPIPNNQIIITDGTTEITRVTTNNNGEATFSYTPSTVGIVNFHVESTETYHYEQAITDVPITIDKDTPIIYMRAVQQDPSWNYNWEEPLQKETFTFNKGNIIPEIQVRTMKSDKTAKISDLILYEDTRLKVNHQLTTITTNAYGNKRYTYSVENGLRMVTAIHEETEFYYSAQRSIYVMYDLDETFRLNIQNYKATLAVDPQVLPVGLYDVIMNFQGTKIYGSSTNNQGIDIKMPTHFELINTPPIHAEPMTQITVDVRLLNRNNKRLIDRLVYSSINNDDLFQTFTNNQGIATRDILTIPTTTNQKKAMAIEAINKVGVTDNLYFERPFSQEETGCDITIPITWDKITPVLILEAPEKFYVSTDGTFKCELYYERFGQKVPLSNETIQLRTTSTYVLLTEITTDKNGKGEVTYNKGSTSNNVECQAILKETDKLKKVTAPFILNVVEKLQANMQTYNTTATYSIPCTLTIRLLDENNNPMKNNKIKFKISTTSLGEATTDNNGYATISYTPNKVGPINIQAIRPVQSKTDPYANLSEFFTLNVEKLEPTITLTSNKNDGIKYTDEITLSSKLLANSKPLKNETIYFYENNTLLGEAVTSSTGIATLKCKPLSGTRNFKAVYKGNTYYTQVEATKSLEVAKQTTIIKTSYESDSQSYDAYEKVTHTITLQDAKGNTISNAQITNKIDGTLEKTSITNNNGQIGYEYQLNAHSSTHTLLYEYSGDDNYLPSTKTVIIKFGKIQPYLVVQNCSGTANEQTELPAELYYKNYNGIQTPISNKTITFKEGSTTLGTATTNNNGKAILNHIFTTGGTKTISVKFNSDSEFFGTTDSFTITLEDGVTIEPCDTLSTFWEGTMSWYATSSDIKSQCRPLSTGGAYSDGESVHSPTGVYLMAKNLKIDSDCTVTFDVTFKSNSKGYIGGHFGVNTETAHTIGHNMEYAPIRFEQYGTPTPNGYLVQGNLRRSVQDFPAFEANKKYSMQLTIKYPRCTFKLKDKNKVYQSAVNLDSFISGGLGQTPLYPYCFAYIAGSEVILSEIRIEKL